MTEWDGAERWSLRRMADEYGAVVVGVVGFGVARRALGVDGFWPGLGLLLAVIAVVVLCVAAWRRRLTPDPWASRIASARARALEADDGRPVFAVGRRGTPAAFGSLADAYDLDADEVRDGTYERVYTLDGRVVGIRVVRGGVVLEPTDAYDDADLAARLRAYAARELPDVDPDDRLAIARALVDRRWQRRTRLPGRLDRWYNGEPPVVRGDAHQGAGS